MSMESSQSKKWERRRREGRRWEDAQKKKKWVVWAAYICDVCVLRLLGSVECRVALYSPPVKTVDAHLGEVEFGSLHLAGWGISCYAAMPKHSSNATLNSGLISLVATQKNPQEQPININTFSTVNVLKLNASQTALRECYLSSKLEC